MPGSDWEDAAELAGYLAELGVTHAYSSPLLRSAEGSNHGYDTSTTRDRRGARRAGRVRPSSRRCTSTGSVWWSTSCPTTSASPTPLQRRGGGTCCCAARDSRSTPPRSTSTGSSAAARSGCRCSATADDARAAAASRTASCATTTTGSRSRRHRRRHAARGARPPALRADELPARRRRAELPPVLRDQHAGRDPGGGPGGVRRDRTQEIAQLVRRRLGGRAADRPPGRPGRPGGLPGPAGRGVGRPLDVLVEKIIERGESCRTTGRRGHHRVRGAGRGGPACSPTRPARRALDDAGHPVARRLRGRLARARRTTASGRWPTGSCARRCCGWPGWCPASTTRSRPTRSPSCWLASPCTAPTSRSAREYLDEAVAAVATAARSSPAPSTRSPRVLADVGSESAAVPADVGHGDGQGRRGLRVLPVDPADRADRGGRRPGRSSAVDAAEFHDAAGAPAASAARPR